mmetsp:Transcript_42437/g.99638  ORF Transcript_42437/g.99638 Transcript_42437/m.99638 type:complete len:312 (-) Transcript_42437:303-1238(-)
MCGPRAWFGRFVCKSFGIPTWGVRQPGHAAMSRWTPDAGWVICLGGGWHKSWWRDRHGLDFLLEARARSARSCDSDDSYMQVVRLQCIASAMDEAAVDIKLKSIGVERNLWNTLSIMKKKILITDNTPNVKTDILAPSHVKTMFEKLLATPLRTQDKTVRINPLNGIITVPSGSLSSPSCKSNADVHFMRCFDNGGLQVHVRKNWTLQYDVYVPISTWQQQVNVKSYHDYMLVASVVTVHERQFPISLVVSNNDVDNNILQLVVPYTAGEWGQTDPISVRLATGQNTLSFSQNATDSYGVSIKEFVLTPCH